MTRRIVSALRLFGACISLFGWVAIWPAQASDPLCPTQLRPEIRAVIDRPALARARLGLVIQPLGGRTSLYEHGAQRFFLPASTTKVLTTAAALTALGPQFQIETRIYGAGEAPQLEHLRIVGGGDPSLTDAQLVQVAQHLRRQGVDRIEQLIADDSTFTGPAVVPSWEWEDLHAGYGAPVNSLILNQNAYVLKLWPQRQGQPLRVEWLSDPPDLPWRLRNNAQTVASSAPEFLGVVRTVNEGTLEIEINGQLRAGAQPDEIDIAVVDPGQYLLRRFRQILVDHQIQVGPLFLLKDAAMRTQVLRAGPPERLWTQVQSPPLSDLITVTNQASNNLYAEALLQVLGTAVPERDVSPGQTTRERGLAVLKQTLTALGVDPNSYDTVDGSGLSRHNLVSPEALVQVLQGMAQSQYAPWFQASLATAGESGTLKHRFVQTPVKGVLRGKTGTLTGVSALAGYLARPHLSPLVFSILFNQYNQSRAELNRAYEDILVLLTRLQAC